MEGSPIIHAHTFSIVMLVRQQQHKGEVMYNRTSVRGLLN